MDDGQGDYLNCPMTKEEYERFYDALVAAESATVHDFDKATFFEGLPADRGDGASRTRHAAIRSDEAGRPRPIRARDAVRTRSCSCGRTRWPAITGASSGFQTQIKWGDQARVLRLIPGLENAEFVRLGMVHRNTYINGPTVLRDTWQSRRRDDLFFAGQVSGVEGYVESAASGLIAGRNAAALALGEPPASPPRTTAIGALAYYVSHAEAKHYQPSNITFGIMAPSTTPRASGRRRAPIGSPAISARALATLGDWQAARVAAVPDIAELTGRGADMAGRPPRGGDRPRREGRGPRHAAACDRRFRRSSQATTATRPATPSARTKAISSSS